MPTDHGEISRLRTALRDLVALSTIPAAWVGREPAAIAAGLADVLVGALRLDFAFVRLCDPNGSSTVEVTRGDGWKAFPEWLRDRAAAGAPWSRKEIVPDVGGGPARGRGLVIPIGVNGDGGLVAVAGDRIDFPAETDQLLLSVAANHAATAFQSARLIHERRRAEDELRYARDQLERKVAERTAELRAILDASPIGIVLFREDQTVQHCNPAFERLVGWRADEIVGRRLPSSEPGEERWTPLAARLARGEGFSGVEVPILRKDGSQFEVALACAPLLDERGRAAGFVANIEDISERKRAEEEHQAHLWFLESMDRVNRAIQGTNDVRQMMSDVLEVVLSVFACDRSWLAYPCDPHASAWSLRMEHTRPEFPGAFALGLELPVDPDIATAFQAVRESSRAVRFGPAPGHRLSAEAATRFSVQSMIAMAIHPRGERPYMFGLHQCSYPRAWTSQGERLFQEIGRRLEEALTSLLMFHNLGESERRLEAAQRISHVGYWERDLATSRYTWSDETYRIFGLPPQQRILTFDDVQEFLHPADRQRRAAAVAEAVQGGPRYAVEYRVVRPDGEVRFVRSEGDVVRDDAGQPRRVFGTVQDITDRKRAEQRLLAQHAVTQILADAATLEDATPRLLRAVCECLVWDVAALWRIDREAGVLRFVEVWHKHSVEVPEFEAASRRTTFEPGVGLPGRVWFNREPAYVPDVARDATFLRAPIAGGEVLHAAFGFPILLGGDVLGVMEFFSHEIRQPDPDLLDMMAIIGSQIGQFIDRKQAEEALRRTQAELAHVTRVATLGEMTASIAHEINQPLAAVVNNATACLHWLAAQNLEEARQSAEFVIADGHRAGEIIGRIRALAKKGPPRNDAVDVNATLLEVIALARSELHRSGVSLQTQLNDDLPLVAGDRIQLQQVILNLMINALEAMSTVNGGPRELSIASARHDAQSIVVTVRDSGPGLNVENVDRLFQAFYTTKPHGMGMGLAISRSIVEAHGGRLWATANAPRGAVFQFTLPVGDARSR